MSMTTNENNMDRTREISYSLPNGLRVVADMHGDATGVGNGWACMDISIHFPNGHVEALCSVDYEAQMPEFRDFNRLRVLTFKPGGDDPDTITMPLPHRSIWISLDEGTYDVNVWDEDANDRDDFFEVGHIASQEEAERIMRGIISDHSFIWTVRELQIK